MLIKIKKEIEVDAMKLKNPTGKEIVGMAGGVTCVFPPHKEVIIENLDHAAILLKPESEAKLAGLIEAEPEEHKKTVKK